MVPKRLRDDAIIETVLQVQFANSRQSVVPEVVLGRLSDFGTGFSTVRLPQADLPAALRRSNPQFSHLPLMELRRDPGRVMRIGENVLSWHVLGVKAYPGWEDFSQELKAAVAHLFDKVEGVEISNVSLRYINALVRDRHFISGVHDLVLRVDVGRTQFLGPLNLNLGEQPEEGRYLVTTRVADPSFVQGTLPPGSVAIVDVEVSTLPGFRARTAEEVLGWVEDAHMQEKRAFFRLIPEHAQAQLTED